MAGEEYSIVNPSDVNGIITEQLLKNLTEINDIENTVFKDLIKAKVLSIVVLGLVSFLLGLLPLKLAKWFNWDFIKNNEGGGGGGGGKTSRGNLVISLLLCFGGGVLIFTTFIHLQPEVREELEHLIKEKKAPDFPQLADLVFCLGFFFVYLIEEIVHGVIERKHNHNEDETFFHRTVSLRSCNKGKERRGNNNNNVVVMADGHEKIMTARPKMNHLNPDEKISNDSNSPKSMSTQILFDSSSVSTLNQNVGSNGVGVGGTNIFEESYPNRFSPLDPGSHLNGGDKYGIYAVSYGGIHDDCKAEDDDKSKNNYDKSRVYKKSSHHSSHNHHCHSFFDSDTSSSSSGDSLHLANTFRGFFTVLALSFHAVFEGLAVGLENEVSNVWYLFLAIATHKFVIAFCVGVDLVSTKTKNFLILLYLGTFAFVTPLGIGIGIALSNDPSKSGSELSTVILQGMAAGTLLYVVFFEVLQRERANNQSGILQLMAIVAGFGVMFALQFISKFF